METKSSSISRLTLILGTDTVSDRTHPDLKPCMQLLIAVINHEEKLDDVLAGFVELGITGATIIGSEGMGRVLSHDVPIFAGLRSLTARSRPNNQTIFSVVQDDKVDAAIALMQEVCGDLNSPGAGIVFVVPVSRVVGLAPELESEQKPAD